MISLICEESINMLRLKERENDKLLLPDMILRLNLKKRGSIKTERKKRVEWIDIAKGFAMILVVIGHTAFSTSKQEILRAMIFSFHMPLFFILSGMTLSFADNWKQLMNKTVKDVKNLLIPYVVCYILSTIIGLFFAPSNITNKYYFTANLLGFIYASGVPTTFGTYEVFSAGAIWFFVCLFCARLLLRLLFLLIKNNPLRIIISVLLCLCGISIGENQYLILSFDLALIAQLFLMIGCFLNRWRYPFTRFPWLQLLIYGGIWSILLHHYYAPLDGNRLYMELAIRRMEFFPDVLISFAGTMALCEFSVLTTKWPAAKRFFSWIGMNSLLLLCIHSFDYYFFPVWWDNVNFVFHSGMRILFDLLVLALYQFTVCLLKKKVRKRTA